MHTHLRGRGASLEYCRDGKLSISCIHLGKVAVIRMQTAIMQAVKLHPTYLYVLKEV